MRITILAVAVLALAGCAGNTPVAQTAPVVTPVVTTHTVVYEAEGPGASGPRTASITLQTDGGGSSQQAGVALPLASKAGGKGLTFTRFHSGDFVYLSVQNSDAAGDVTCRILVDGTVVSENTSSGGYTIATCQATVR